MRSSASTYSWLAVVRCGTSSTNVPVERMDAQTAATMSSIPSDTCPASSTRTSRTPVTPSDSIVAAAAGAPPLLLA